MCILYIILIICNYEYTFVKKINNIFECNLGYFKPKDFAKMSMVLKALNESQHTIALPEHFRFQIGWPRINFSRKRCSAFGGLFFGLINDVMAFIIEICSNLVSKWFIQCKPQCVMRTPWLITESYYKPPKDYTLWNFSDDAGYLFHRVFLFPSLSSSHV